MSMGGSLLANCKARESGITAVVTRCGCGAPAAHAGLPCPRPRASENLGTIAYWHRNPLRRWAWRARRFLARAVERS